jgi:hypothetical protein
VRVSWRRRTSLTGVLLLAACGPATVTGDDGAGPRQEVTPVPFTDFLRAVDAARFGDFAARPGTAVPDQAAFARMRTFVLDRYRDVRVASTYVAGGAVFDCVWQRSEQLQPPTAGGVPSSVPSQTGSPTPPACPQGAVPVRRVTLEDLVRFSSLEKYLGKSPDGTGQVPPGAPPS